MRRGRKPLSETEKRKRRTIFLTDSEWAKVQAFKSRRLTDSEWAKVQAFIEKTLKKPAP